jgi:hypothetical protein
MKMATASGGGKDGDGKSGGGGGQPNMELIDKIMASVSQPARSGPRRRRMKRIGPGEFEVTDVE